MTWKSILKYSENFGDMAREFINLIEQEGYTQIEKTEGYHSGAVYEKGKSQLSVGDLRHGITAAYLEDDEDEGPVIQSLTMDGIKVLLRGKWRNPHLKDIAPHGEIEGSITQSKLKEEIKAQDTKAILSIWNKMKTKGKPTKHKGLIDFGGYRDLVYGTDEYSKYGPNPNLR